MSIRLLGLKRFSKMLGKTLKSEKESHGWLNFSETFLLLIFPLFFAVWPAMKLWLIKAPQK